MAPEPVELRPTIDRAWLESAALADPVAHAYALWDLDRFPGQVRFVSAHVGGRPVGYLLRWELPGAVPVVQWVAPPLPELAEALPPRPLRVNAPVEAVGLVRAARGPCVEQPLLLESAPLGTVPPPTPFDGRIRPLTRADTAALDRLARSSSDEMAVSYRGLDPGAEAILGGFDGPELVAVARASVRRPSVWFVSGVYVRPALRGRGWGKAVTRAVMEAARGAGAFSALYVRESRPDARAAYDRLGFQPIARRVLVDCGVPPAP
jgi:GNAT superfamily N-acetyltransferase